MLNLGAVHQPDLKQDNTDRKEPLHLHLLEIFEFRAAGSSASVSFPLPV